MEKQLKYVLQLSLKQMALRKVATILCNDLDILSAVTKIYCSTLTIPKYEKKWQEDFVERVKFKVSKLELPESLMKQMMAIINPIGLQLKLWKESLEYLFEMRDDETISLPYLEKLRWTNTGTIDYRKTAEELLHCDMVDVVHRYRLACLYCFEDYIPLLWKKLPKNMKGYFRNKKDNPPCLHSCWPHIIQGKLFKLDYLLETADTILTSFNQYAFEYSAKTNNKTAAEYFFQKLTHEERDISLLRTTIAVAANIADDSFDDCLFPKEKLSDVFCYLLSFLNPEQQMKVCKAEPVGVLLCFFNWPWQDLFLENARFMWTFLPSNCYELLVQNMHLNLETFDHFFSGLFQEFFIESPHDFRKHFVRHNSEFVLNPVYCCLFFFFMKKDAEAIKTIFRNIDAEDRERILFNWNALSFFYMSILNNDWNMLEVCLEEATLSKEAKERYKKRFIAFLTDNNRGQINYDVQKVDRFLRFFDEPIMKRKLKRKLASTES